MRLGLSFLFQPGRQGPLFVVLPDLVFAGPSPWIWLWDGVAM